MLEKNKPPGGLNSGFTVGGIFVVLGGPVVLKSDLRSLVLLGERCVTPKNGCEGDYNLVRSRSTRCKRTESRAQWRIHMRGSGGGGHPDPEIKRGVVLKYIFFSGPSGLSLAQK